MKIEITCYRLFYNKRDFEDFERHYVWDRIFDSYEEAVVFMHNACGYTSGEQMFTFDVTILDRDWDKIEEDEE